MSVFDLKTYSNHGQTLSSLLKGPDRVQRSLHLLAINGFLSKTRIQQVRPAAQRKPQSKHLYLLGPVHVNGVCSTDRQRKFTRYRNMSSIFRAQTLSRRHSRKHLSQHTGRCQRKARLANISGFRTSSDYSSKVALRQRRIRRNIGQRSLRTGLNDYRPLPNLVSMGTVSQTQKCRQDAYTVRPEWVDSVLYTRHRRPSTRCQCSRRSAFRGRSILRHGQSLHRLRTTIQIYKEHGIFCYTCQNQLGFYQMQLSPGRQNNRTKKRSNDSSQSTEKFAVLPRPSSIYYLLRCRHKKEICVFDKQLYSGCIDNRTALQMPLEDRTVLQVDQTALANQGFLWNFRERSQNTNLDCCQHLLTRSYNEKRAEFATEFVRNPANSQHYDFPERPYYTSTYEKSPAKRKY